MLDKSRPYGRIRGSGEIKAAYFQDGHYYGLDGSYIGSDPGKTPPAHVIRQKNIDDAGKNHVPPPPPPPAPPGEVTAKTSGVAITASATGHVVEGNGAEGEGSNDQGQDETGAGQDQGNPGGDDQGQGEDGGEDGGQGEQAPGLTAQQQLAQLNVPKLQELQIAILRQANPALDMPSIKKLVIRGPGAKQKLIDWILENSES